MLFSDVAGSMRETHVGTDNRAAGRTAGLLLGRMCGAGGRGFYAYGPYAQQPPEGVGPFPDNARLTDSSVMPR